MKKLSAKHLVFEVDKKCNAGFKQTGCFDSAYDRAYYLAQVAMPERNDDEHREFASAAVELISDDQPTLAGRQTR